MINPRTTHLLIRHQEIALKGKNRQDFERRLLRNLARCVGSSGDVHTVSGRFVVALTSSAPEQRSLLPLVDKVATLGGVTAVTPCRVIAPEMEQIKQEAVEWAKSDLDLRPEAETFAVRARRVNKSFPLTSSQMDFEVGSLIHDLKDKLTVNLKRPDLRIAIEVRHKHALIYSWEREGVCGLPMDPSQRVAVLLSGGIDSPVAAHELMRRGCTPVFIHFHSKPFTSEASISKVKRLAQVLRGYSSYPLELWLVPLLTIQKTVRDACNERYRTVHYRRFMMKIAEEIARRRDAKALVTGEALGQVASQTLANIHAIGEVATLPVFRPLISLDKQAIVDKAKELGTYEISIEPHEDTCVLFAPNHPATQAKLPAIIAEHESLPNYELIFEALDSAEKILV